MKSSKLLILAAAALTAWSCGDKGPDNPGPGPGDGKLTAPTLTPEPATGVTLNETNATQTALTLSWTAATTESGVAVGYKVYINVASKDIFSDPAVVDAGTALSKTFTNADLNGIVVGLGADYGVAASYKVLVYAEHTNGDYDAVQSNELSVSITPYMPKPDHLIALGASLNWGWTRPNPETPARLTETSPGSGVYEVEDVEMRFTTTSGFKLYFPTEGTDDGFIAQDPAQTTFGKAKYYKTGDEQFLPGSHEYVNGVYTISFDFNAMEVSLEKTGDVSAFPDALYIRGNYPNWNWGNPEQTLNSTSDGVYEITDFPINTSSASDYFFFFPIVGGSNKDWPQYGQLEGGDIGDLWARTTGEDPERGIALFGTEYVNGAYTITVNLNTMKATFTKTGDIVVETKLYIRGNMFNNEWAWNIPGQTLHPVSGSEGVYEGTNIPLIMEDWRTFAFFEISGTTNKDWPQYQQDDTTGIIGDLKIRNRNEDPEIPINLFGSDYTTGLYTIRVDTNALKMTLTRTGDIPG